MHKLYPWTTPIWPLSKVRAFTTLKKNNQKDFNLATHIQCDIQAAQQNRHDLIEMANCPHPVFINQVHGAKVVTASSKASGVDADGLYSTDNQHSLCILTADCLPILLVSEDQQEISALHCGWRSLASGIIDNALAHFKNQPYYAWLGPCISQDCFEVGQDVVDAFAALDLNLSKCFQAKGKKYMGDLNAIAVYLLKERGIQLIYNSGHCTYSMGNDYYSHRRNPLSGRMATVIWRLP